MNRDFFSSDLPPTVRLAAIALLKQQLADALDLGMQAKQAHWNVTGPQFLSLHELFDQVAETMEELSDLVAERAVQIGGVVEGTLQAVARDSRLPAYPLDLHRGADHVRALATALAQFAAAVRKASNDAAGAGDADTSDVLTQVSRAADLLLWKVSAHISEPPEELAAVFPPRIRLADS